MDKIYNDFKDHALENFTKKLILELFVFKVGIFRIDFKNLFIRSTFFLSNLWFQIFSNFFVVYIFLWIWKNNSIFSSTKLSS